MLQKRLDEIEAALWGSDDHPGLVGHTDAMRKLQAYLIRLCIVLGILLVVHLLATDDKWIVKILAKAL